MSKVTKTVFLFLLSLSIATPSFANHGINGLGSFFDLVYIFLVVIFYLFCWMMVIFLFETDVIKKSKFRKIIVGFITLLQISFAIYIYSTTFEITNKFSKIVKVCLLVLLLMPIINSLYVIFSNKKQK